MMNEIWDAFSKRWNLRILKSLELNVVIRFNELKHSIRGISANVLSDRLDELEKLGLIKKIVSKDATIHTGYILNEKCGNLKKILLDLDEWISFWHQNHLIHNETSNNSVLSNKLLKLLRNEINETEFNFIKDKLLFSLGVGSTDLLTNFEKLKNVILELYGNEIGNSILTKLQEKINQSS